MQNEADLLSVFAEVCLSRNASLVDIVTMFMFIIASLTVRRDALFSILNDRRWTNVTGQTAANYRNTVASPYYHRTNGH